MIKVTPKTIQACYLLLAELPPFTRWKLPHVAEIEFVAFKDPDCFGEYEPDPHTIRISTAKNGHLDTLLRTVAHEMVHLVRFCRGDKDWAEHDAKFANMTEQVSHSMGFDPKEL